MGRDWEDGVAMGQALERLRSLHYRTTELEKGQRALAEEVRSIKTLIVRLGFIAVSWGVPLVMLLPAEKVGEIAGAAIASLLKK
jgi:hypothetical protein